ncbi:hypothetical protein [Actinobacillus capsulatus]|uniref:hypothetical protein n=1 Tax=Actinobacillus capsulatus TaxID=717 RepID=UPI00037A57B4|nr:hypothetical protein [Actinobacillus capsulatus]
MYYIINSENRIVGTSDYELNLDDLQSRGEFVIEHATMVNPYFDGEKLVEKGDAPTANHIFDYKKAKWVYNAQFNLNAF